jgi:hypothetical protein
LHIAGLLGFRWNGSMARRLGCARGRYHCEWLQGDLDLAAVQGVVKLPRHDVPFGPLAARCRPVQLCDDRLGQPGKVCRTDRYSAAVYPDPFVEARREVGRRRFAARRPTPQAVNAQADGELCDELFSEHHGYST